MTPVNEGDWISDDVLEVETAGGALEAASAAARNERVLTTPVNLRAVGCKLGFEPVGSGECPLGTTSESADEDLLTGLVVCAARRLIIESTLVYKQPSRLPVMSSPWSQSPATLQGHADNTPVHGRSQQ